MIGSPTSADSGHAAPWSLRGLFLATGAWTAAVAPFIAVILHAHGLDPAQIGVLSALAALGATFLVPAWGHLADVLVGRTAAFRIGVGIAGAASIALLLPLPPMVLAPILASFAIFPALFLALTDALAVGGLPAPERQYGPLRSLASLSFAVGVTVAGYMYDQAGYAAVPVVSIAWAAALYVLAGRVPDRTRDPNVRAIAGRGRGRTRRLGSISRALSVQPRLGPLLAVLTLAYAGMTGAMVFVSLRIVDVGGQPSDVGLSFGLAAVAEIPGLVLAGWAGRRVGLRSVFLWACLAYGLCIASWGVLATPLAINATRIITGVSFGALTTARVLVIGRLLPGELQATGQTLVQAATIGLSSVLGGLIGGVLYGAFGPTVYFAVAGALACVGGFGAWVVLDGPVGGPGHASWTGEATRPEP